jgi:hypothetical protein
MAGVSLNLLCCHQMPRVVSSNLPRHHAASTLRPERKQPALSSAEQMLDVPVVGAVAGTQVHTGMTAVGRRNSR